MTSSIRCAGTTASEMTMSLLPVYRHDEVVAAGRRQTDRAPGVLDLVLLAMHEQEIRGDAGGRRHHGEQDRAVAVINVAREAPAVAQPDAARLKTELRPDRQKRACDRARRDVTPKFVI